MANNKAFINGNSRVYSVHGDRKKLTFKNYNFRWAKRKPGWRWLYKVYLPGAYTIGRKNAKYAKKFYGRIKEKSIHAERWGSLDFTKRRFRHNFNENIIYNREISPISLMVLSLHMGTDRAKWDQKIKTYIMGRRGKNDLFNLDFGMKAYKNTLSYVNLLRRARGLFHHVGTREDDDYRHGIRQLTRHYAHLSSSYHTGNKWLGGTLTNIKQNTLRANLHKHLPMPEMYEYYEWYEFWDARQRHYKYPELVTLFDAIEEEYGINDTRIIGVPALISTDTCIDPDDCYYPIFGSHANNTSIHYYHRILMRAIKIPTRYLWYYRPALYNDYFKKRLEEIDKVSSLWVRVPLLSSQFFQKYSFRTFRYEKFVSKKREKILFKRFVRNPSLVKLVQRISADKNYRARIRVIHKNKYRYNYKLNFTKNNSKDD
uniref:Ribosomal protein S2 n=1 Tax=Phalansterium sp. PJK-2012 TaxID=1267188 RepID=T1QDX7_9EUKA|nr:ribosomal protein S2 [Phalansterium sp. PJK-2012]